MADETVAEFDPIQKARGLFDIVKGSFAPGDLAQGMILGSNGRSAMMAIDTSFFADRMSMVRLTMMVRDKVREIEGEAYIQVADSFRLVNENKQKFEEDPPPRSANVEWLAENGYGEKQDCLLGICQTKLGTWLIRHDYRVVANGKLEWVGEVEVKEGRPEPYTEVFSSTIRIPI